MINLEILKQYGKVIGYSELQGNEIKKVPISGHRFRLMYLVVESEIDQFVNFINNEDGTIHLTDSMSYRYSEVDFKKIYSKYLEIKLCVKGNHFIPDKILRSDILFFFKRSRNGDFFIIIKDKYINQILKREHCIFGMIDLCRGQKLLLEEDRILKSKMEEFHIEINKLSQKYRDILFITVSDSILIKYAFQIISENGKFLTDKFAFNKIIQVFREIRKISRAIFTIDVYGVFSYGMNKCKTIKSDSSNIFHVGIFSNEFKDMFVMEEICRKIKDVKKGDLYMTNDLYHAFRFYIKEKRTAFQSITEHSESEWKISKKDIDETKKVRSISEEDITVFKIFDEPLNLIR